MTCYKVVFNGLCGNNWHKDGFLATDVGVISLSNIPSRRQLPPAGSHLIDRDCYLFLSTT